MRLASERPEPIPCFAEMGSTNPLFVLPGALRERGSQIAQGLQGSFTLGSGQSCTKPGMVFVPQDHSTQFVDALRNGVSKLGAHGMLTHGIAEVQQVDRAESGRREAELIARSDAAVEQNCAAGLPTIFGISLEEFLKASGSGRGSLRTDNTARALRPGARPFESCAGNARPPDGHDSRHRRGSCERPRAYSSAGNQGWPHPLQWLSYRR